MSQKWLGHTWAGGKIFVSRKGHSDFSFSEGLNFCAGRGDKYKRPP